MNKRIRYIRDEHGGWKSMRAIKSANGTSYIAHISSDGRTGKILAAVKSGPAKDFTFEVKGSSPHKTKIALKTALEMLKCPFERESRKKREGEKDV